METIVGTTDNDDLRKQRDTLDVENYELRERLNNAERRLRSFGYSRCDVVACNCKGYHFDGTDEPELLRIPSVSRTTADLLAVARRLDLPNAVLLAQRSDGALIFLTTDLSSAEANFMLDKIKGILVGPPPEFVR